MHYSTFKLKKGLFRISYSSQLTLFFLTICVASMRSSLVSTTGLQFRMSTPHLLLIRTIGSPFEQLTASYDHFVFASGNSSICKTVLWMKTNFCFFSSLPEVIMWKSLCFVSQQGRSIFNFPCVKSDKIFLNSCF